MKPQVFNPYLPSYEYVPDGEPHVFGNRIYLFGSHDRFDGAVFCLNDYVCWSAPVDDLTSWSYEGVIYRKDQDPSNQNNSNSLPETSFWIEPRREDSLNPSGIHAQWAPDVVQGSDGRYYLYYCCDILPEVAVAVCDHPAGKYEFLGFVHHKDGQLLGDADSDLTQFDPGVFKDDDGTVYLYTGNAPRPTDRPGHHGSQVMTLEADMLTLKTEPQTLMPDIRNSQHTGYEGHEFFEASSIRHIGNRYYFVYSSIQCHELCYAVSQYPDRDYVFGGTLVDIGDIYLNGRTEAKAVAPLGNTHGGIECCCGQWYVFYHRQTNRTNFSRQACAEKITILEDGSIKQVEVTSCGLNNGPLEGEGIYPARIACELNLNGSSVMSNPFTMHMDYPFYTQDIADITPDDQEALDDQRFPIQYICNMRDGAAAGYKYFSLNQEQFSIAVTVRRCMYQEKLPSHEHMISILKNQGMDPDDPSVQDHLKNIVYTEVEMPEPEGMIEILESPEGTVCGRIAVSGVDANWKRITAPVALKPGIQALYFRYRGTGSLDFAQFELIPA